MTNDPAHAGPHECSAKCGRPTAGRTPMIEAWGAYWHFVCLPGEDEIRAHGSLAAAVEARRDDRDR